MTHHLSLALLALLFGSGLYAGAQNAVAGGGSFISFPALVLAGLNPIAANMTSTVALLPTQFTAGFTGRKVASGLHALSLAQLFWISLLGGAIGAILLIYTPPIFFERLLPWLILFATLVFAWGSFRKKRLTARPIPLATLIAVQFAISIYGGYFGGGIGFMMLAMLTIAGQEIRAALATKNVLATVMNISAVILFSCSGRIDWLAALALGLGGIGGTFVGNWAMSRISDHKLRILIVGIGLILTVWFFIRQG